MAKARKIINRGPGFSCVFCDRHFSGSTSQPIHIRRHIHEKPYNCRSCHFSATCITDVYLHERKVHSSIQYKCSWCDREFKNSYTLKTHFQSTHCEIIWKTPYNCSICKKDFKLQSNLTQHMRMHSAEKCYKCDKCGVQFAVGRSLELHVKKAACSKVGTSKKAPRSVAPSPSSKKGKAVPFRKANMTPSKKNGKVPVQKAATANKRSGRKIRAKSSQ